MDEFKTYLTKTFNKLNVQDSSIDESGFLQINHNIYDHFNGKTQMTINGNLNCLHELVIDMDENLANNVNEGLIDANKIIQDHVIQHIEKGLLTKSKSKIIVCMFLYSATITKNNIIVKSNFKLK
jgi:hypothetical protein